MTPSLLYYVPEYICPLLHAMSYKKPFFSALFSLSGAYGLPCLELQNGGHV